VIVAVEGIDGAGKHTLTVGLAEAIRQRGGSVAIFEYPRYDDPPLGPLIRALLAGEPALASLRDNPVASALLFALDRAGSSPQLTECAAQHDCVLIDRYIASNAVYTAARLPAGDTQSAFLDWIVETEVDQLGIARPDLQVLVNSPVDEARSGVQSRASIVDRPADTFETDQELQARCAELFLALATRRWLSEWLVVPRSADLAEVVDRCVAGSASYSDNLPR
jgi:dTMP kinase